MDPAAIFNRRIVQNFIIRKPGRGVIALGLFCYLFAVIYRPLDTHPGQHLGYGATMAVYCTVISLAAYLTILLLKRIPLFSRALEWTVIKEVSAVLLVLFVMGVAAFLAAFAIEPPADRWNISTFLNSLAITFMASIIPFAFFSLINIRLWVPYEHKTEDTEKQDPGPLDIESRLKKEKLRLLPERLVFAESEGNYVVFHIETEGGVSRRMIRNSISDIEKQLSTCDNIFRTHRAFLVNLDKVIMKKGNTLGYRLKLKGTDREVPVSRNNTQRFNRLMEG